MEILDAAFEGLPLGISVILSTLVVILSGLWAWAHLKHRESLDKLEGARASIEAAMNRVVAAIELEGRRMRETAHKHHDELLERMREQDKIAAEHAKENGERMAHLTGRINAR